MLELRYGIVKSFDNRPQKNYGWLGILDENGQETGESIFFHFTYGQFVAVVEGGDIQFVGRVLAKNGSHMRRPKAGDKLAFLRADTSDGRGIACSWTYAAEYDNCVRTLTTPRYRVTKVTTLSFGDPGDKLELVWEGQGVDELLREYPIRALSGRLDDPLARLVNFAAGRMTHYRFEVYVQDFADDGHGGRSPTPACWQLCEDPRYSSELVRKLMGP